jgi:hypothetical protein
MSIASTSPAWMASRRAGRARPQWFGQHARIEQLVQQDRMSRQVIRGPLRRTHELRETRQHRRMLGQEREIRAAAAHRLQEPEQAMEHGLRSAPRRIARGGKAAAPVRRPLRDGASR